MSRPRKPRLNLQSKPQPVSKARPRRRQGLSRTQPRNPVPRALRPKS
jgi:hypothetical protein